MYKIIYVLLPGDLRCNDVLLLSLSNMSVSCYSLCTAIKNVRCAVVRQLILWLLVLNVVLQVTI